MKKRKMKKTETENPKPKLTNLSNPLKFEGAISTLDPLPKNSIRTQHEESKRRKHPSPKNAKKLNTPPRK
jgi:hypothetical protein